MSLHDPPDSTVSSTGLKLVSLGLGENSALDFLRWLEQHPQDAIISSGVSHIESSFPYLPTETRHIVQIHDCLRRYHRVAVSNSLNIDGVICVAHHITRSLEEPLNSAGFCGILRTIHNGADFPPPVARPQNKGPIRLLFMGRTDPLKGVSDLPCIMKELRRSGVTATLTIVGPIDETLERAFSRSRVSKYVVWKGLIPHHECFSEAANADILLMPSRKEPFGMVTIEAMSMGCVPMAYNVTSGSTEIITQGRNGILIPLGNVRKWAQEIAVLDQERERLALLSVTASEDARSCFSSKRMGLELKEFIVELAQLNRSNSERLPAASFPQDSPDNLPKARVYQRLSPKIRNLVRWELGKRAKLCNWILNRI